MSSLGSLVVALLGGALPAQATPAVVIALTSDSLETYKQVVAAFAAEIPAMDVARFDLGGDAKRAEATADAIRSRKPALIFAVGPLAANVAHRSLKDIPAVFALVPNYEKYGLDGNVTGIGLTRPVDEQLAALHELFPAAKRVGVLYTPELSQEVIAQAIPAARAHSLELVTEKLAPDSDIAAAAARLAAHADVLWMIADRGTATMTASSAILGACRRAHLPLVALTEGQVREGALLAFTTSPAAIGAQAGKLVGRIVSEKIDVSALAVAPPSGLELWVSTAATKGLGLDGPWTAHLLEYAAQKGIGVRPTP